MKTAALKSWFAATLANIGEPQYDDMPGFGIAANYDPALSELLKHEGGFSNDAADPGGPTKYGITIFDVRRFLNPHANITDVRALTLDQAKEIYAGKYWNAVRGDQLPAGVDYTIFDYGVNSGVGRAIKVLQRCIGADDDGKFGPKTMQLVNVRITNFPQRVHYIEMICDERLRFLKSLRTWPVFGKGWNNRVRDVRLTALAMAKQETPA